MPPWAGLDTAPWGEGFGHGETLLSPGEVQDEQWMWRGEGGGHFPIAAAGASQQCLFLVSDAPGSVVTVHIPNSCLLQQDFRCLLC